MHSLQQERAEAREVAVLASEIRLALYRALMAEFEEDLERWGASISREDLTVRFNEPDVLFEQNSDALQPRFRDILDDFFPRYVAVLRNPQFRPHIEEIRVEGHTSSEWNQSVSDFDAYFLNLELSQLRTRSVFRYAAGIPVLPAPNWVRAHTVAVGMSSSRPVLDERGLEDRSASRRVEFRVETSFEERIIEAIGGANG